MESLRVLPHVLRKRLSVFPVCVWNACRRVRGSRLERHHTARDRGIGLDRGIFIVAFILSFKSWGKGDKGKGL